MKDILRAPFRVRESESANPTEKLVVNLSEKDSLR